MDVLVAIDTVDDFLHNAKLVPLSDSVRVCPDELREGVERIRAGLMAILPDPHRSQSLPLVERLEEMVRTARPVPLTRHVRVDKEQMYDLLDQLRASLPEDLRP